MRSYKIHGIILRRSNFSEADKLITIFTKEQGKIKVLAKGIRRIKSRRAPHLELFNHVEVVLHEGKTFSVVTEAKILDDLVCLKLNLKSTGLLFYLCEVIDKILPEHQPHAELYEIFLASLSGLNQDKVKKFVVELLWNLGYLPKGEYPKLGITTFVENIVEKRIRSKKFLEEI